MRNVDAAGLAIGDDHPPRLMGVLNVSKESPYKPSVFDDPGEAAEYVDRDLIDEGADIVDVGLESANKRLDVLSAEEELDRLDTAIETIESVSGEAVYSIETRYAEVAAEALDRGFDVVNDICGFADPEMPAVCEARDAAVFKMASPPDLDRPGAVEETPWAERTGEQWAEQADYVDQVYEALKQNGFTEKTMVDPAFGGWSEFKDVEHDAETFRRLREFRGLGRPILVSINRKNFLREPAGRDTEGALPVSLAATSMAVERGAHVIRTHDVAETRDAAIIGAEFSRERVRTDEPVAVEELDVTTVREAERHANRLGIDADVADDAVVRTIELSGLTRAERDAVASAAAGDLGATFSAASADGRASDGHEGGAGLLVGTESAISSVAQAALGESSRLDDALGVVSDTFR